MSWQQNADSLIAYGQGKFSACLICDATGSVVAKSGDICMDGVWKRGEKLSVNGKFYYMVGSEIDLDSTCKVCVHKGGKDTLVVAFDLPGHLSSFKLIVHMIDDVAGQQGMIPIKQFVDGWANPRS